MKIYSSFTPKKPKKIWAKPKFLSKKFFIFFIILIILFLIIIFNLNSPKSSEQISLVDTNSSEKLSEAQIIGIKGIVQIYQQEENQWTNLNQDDILAEGSTILTSDSGRAIIKLPDGSIFRMNSNSQITLEQFNFANIVLIQEKGEVYHRVNEQSPSIYNVRHNLTESTALGTGFDLIVSEQNSELQVIASRVKVKVYENTDLDNILSMRTIDEGYYAKINPTLEPDKMIESEEKELADIINNDWLVWNKEQDSQLGVYLGIFEKNIVLTLSEPTQTELKTNEDKITIKGSTDTEAEIFIDGKDVKNNNGNFETEVALQAGENIINIVVKKDKKIEKKILYITKTDAEENITLTSTLQNKNLSLSWKINSETTPTGYRVFQATTNNISSGTEPYHFTENTSDIWENLADGTYYFRVCAFADDKCISWSNTISEKIGGVSASLSLTGTKTSNSISLTWSGENLTDNQFDNFHILFSNETTPSWPTSNYHVVNKLIFTDTLTDLTNDTEYKIRVCLFKDNDCQTYSNILTIKTDPAENTNTETPPTNSNPGAITLSGESEQSAVNLSLTTANPTNSEFFIMVSFSTEPTLENSDTVKTSNKNYRWANLKPATTYFFRVCQAVGEACGTYSNIISLTTK
ncbi:hypothetical protein A2533_01765 [Candidatus Falkowbacteria bacterium RIFOXYD2_FULL_35_9]|uniref:Fibronectin type-III domain-containing protein n=1 Tax=Candidatus Falkowbacteria bacterium RIFOXYC2_FULL_36_12 TaxID=1798002 RepID=A0A1F5SZZ2_9BACT|nr:MAG: hypothetical protein A2300_00930 [Candidatus Falkowbacteria bacterium RIFOXYB2_FULL_35_7]OGF32270.1 MAG: hypothetical protein A2478_03010 [Candidatus Falkowbacteria bacterium RIFOXYC2_FULL_36_12]OGF47964.1 MAG: hypothetical protein A2533_01765 [Candidatus Falkowbacteria bacterium RIFOXYD2_FULL_35_9]